MLNLKTLLLILCISVLAISYLNAQAPNLTVEGWAKIDGERLEFSNDDNSNIFIGFDSGTNVDVFGRFNTSLGYQTLSNNVDGSNNVAIGYQALLENIFGNTNTAVGRRTLFRNISGSSNTAIGDMTLSHNTTGASNTGVGNVALFQNTSGTANTATGSRTLQHNTEGNYNTATGSRTLYHNTEGDYNTATGYRALYNNIAGDYNIAIGYRALYDNTTGHLNAAFGYDALNKNYTGSQNTAFGPEALYFNYTGTHNTALGYQAFYFGEFYSNSTAVGYGSRIFASNQIRFGNSDITSIGGYEPWSTVSDKRLKKNIKKDIPGLDFITQLRPVSYQLDMENIAKWHQTPDSLRNHKSETTKGNIRYSGFLAQEVEAAAKEIGYDFSGVDQPKNEGDRYGIRYSQFVIPLVKAVQELNEEKEDTATKLQKLEEEIATLKALLMSQQQAVVPQQAVELRSPDQAVQSAKLAQNKPNPFNGHTTIDYFIPAGFQQAIIRIADSTGKLVKDVKIQKSGAGQIEIDATLLNNGNYFYTLVLDGQLVDSKQMVLLK